MPRSKVSFPPDPRPHEAAEVLEVSHAYIYKLMHSGELESYTLNASERKRGRRFIRAKSLRKLKDRWDREKAQSEEVVSK